MSDFSSLFDNAAFVVNFILQLILIIVFIKMAINVSKIKNHLTGDSSRQLIRQAEKAIFKGQKEKAIDAYFDVLFSEINKTDATIDELKKVVIETITKINKLGGTVSDSAMAIIEKEVGPLK